MRIFEAHRRHQDRQHPALSYRGQVISYGELDEQVSRFAGYFQHLGVQPGDRVAICSPNCPEFVYSYLGAALAGAIVVPINLMLSLPEIAFILQDAGVSCLVIYPVILQKVSLPADASSLGIKSLVVLNEETLAAINQAGEPQPVKVKEDDTCSLLYTSGTTGKPKGAMLTHFNLMSNVRSLDEASDLGPDDRFICVLPMFHSFAWTVCVLLPLYLGSTIYILDSFGPKELLRTLVEDKITVFCGVPSMFAVLVRMGEAAQLSLKLAIAGGAGLPAEVQKGFEAKFSFPLIEGYGLSEASPVCCLNPLAPEAVRKPGSIGIPLPGVKMRLVDDEDRDVPRGEVGEIVVQGPNVMKGYWNLPEATAETLRNGWLHTGDLGRQDEDGYFYVVDRKKDMIICAGFNVYPREVEEVLLTHPQVVEAAVVGVGDPLKGETIKAFVVLEEQAQLDGRALQEFLKDRIASYKIPRLWEFVSELPKGATGKVLKKLLKEAR